MIEQEIDSPLINGEYLAKDCEGNEVNIGDYVQVLFVDDVPCGSIYHLKGRTIKVTSSIRIVNDTFKRMGWINDMEYGRINEWNGRRFKLVTKTEADQIRDEIAKLQARLNELEGV